MQLCGGGTPKTNVASYWNGDIPFFSPKDVGNYYCLSTEKSITESGLNNCNSALFPINTVFVTARGTVGKVNLAGKPMAMNQSCYALVGKGIDQLVVHQLTLKTVASLKHKATGAVFDAITTRDFNSETVGRLSVKQMNDFVSYAKPIYSSILEKLYENERLAALRDTLLPKLMSGEIDVSDVEI